MAVVMRNLQKINTNIENKGYRILLAEDDPTNQFVTKTILEKNGFNVVCANNGVEACNILEKQSFDLILMDVSMPEMDGLEATRQFRKQQPIRENTPIIALTAHNLMEVYDSCMDVGMSDFLSKPIKGKDLISKIGLWL